MRFFPSAEGILPALRTCLRSRRLISALIVVLASALFLVPHAVAEDEDELKRKQKQVQSQIDKAQDNLHQSSKKVSRLNGKLDSARADLAAARSRLGKVQRELSLAQAKADRIAAQLEKAEQRLAKATAEVKQARLEVAAQRDAVRDTVITFATQGDPRLQAISAFLNSKSLEDVMVTQTANELVVDVQFQSLHDLEDAEAALAKRKKEVAAARNEVAEKNAEAEAQVRRTRQLVDRAAATRNQVNALVANTAVAKRKATKARAKDRKALARLEAREKAIRRKVLAAQSSDGNYKGNPDGYLDVPVNGRITSGYGYRTHPIYGYWGLHDGVDFSAPCGSPLFAGSDGRVVHAYYDEVYGYRLYLDIGRVNGDRLTLVYNHMPRLNARTGQAFARGDVVGYVGTTGWSTGCHLHFTVLRNGDPVDPMIYL